MCDIIGKRYMSRVAPPAVVPSATVDYFNRSHSHAKRMSAMSSLLKKPKRKQVSFPTNCDLTDETPCTLSSPLNQLESVREWKELWYGPQEIANFQREAREICSQLRSIHLDPNDRTDEIGGKSSQSSVRSPMMAQNDDTRGLENRVCLERQRRRYVTIRCIVKVASGRNKDPYQLALLAQRCNIWATELAIEEAARDHKRAWMEN